VQTRCLRNPLSRACRQDEAEKLTSEERAREAYAEQTNRYPLFSEVAIAGHCPKCGGMQFKPSRGSKGMIVVRPSAYALTPRSLIQCVTCGALYRKG
jgi:uncharacterized protein with PIN domain